MLTFIFGKIGCVVDEEKKRSYGVTNRISMYCVQSERCAKNLARLVHASKTGIRRCGGQGNVDFRVSVCSCSSLTVIFEGVECTI
jgi:hypothetical protein